MNKTILWPSIGLIALTIAGALAWAAQTPDKFKGPWVIKDIDMGNDEEFSELVKDKEMKGKRRWFAGAGEIYFDVKDDWNNAFQKFTFHRVERNKPLPACTQVTSDVEDMLGEAVNVLVGVGHVKHPAASGNHLEDAHLMFLIPCTGADATKPEFQMVVRSFAVGTGGPVSHNGMIHGVGK